MSTRVLATTVLVLLLTVGATAQNDADWTIVPGEHFGPVTASTSEESLFEASGDGEVVRDSIGIGEGFCVPGTVMYPASANRVEIVWTDSTRRTPAFLRVWHEGGSNSEWKTSDGIYLGMTLDELQSLNGAPFTFSGFGWDYGGSVGTMEGGRLADSFERGLHLALYIDRDSLSVLSKHGDVKEMFGDRLVRSDHPVVRRAGVRVVMISLRFAAANPSDALFCG